MRIENCHHGVDKTVIRFGGAADGSCAEWGAVLVEMVDALCHAADFEVPDTGYRGRIGPFATDGVECRYRRQSFAIWSDEPNQIVIEFRGLRPRKAEMLVQALGEAWAGVAE